MDSQRPYDEWHRDVVHVNRRKEDYRDDQSNYHPSEVLGRQGLEEVRPSAGLVANVVADIVGYHRGVPRVVLRDVLLDLPDEVRSHVCRLCKDSSAELSEQRGERSAEPEASQDAGVSEGGVEERYTKQTHADNREPQGTPPKRCYLQCLVGRLRS